MPAFDAHQRSNLAGLGNAFDIGDGARHFDALRRFADLVIKIIDQFEGFSRVAVFFVGGRHPDREKLGIDAALLEFAQRGLRQRRFVGQCTAIQIGPVQEVGMGIDHQRLFMNSLGIAIGHGCV